MKVGSGFNNCFAIFTDKTPYKISNYLILNT